MPGEVGGVPATPGRWGRRPRRPLLAAEFLILYVVLVGGYAAAGSPGSPILPLLALAPAAVVHLRRQPDFDRRNLLRPEALRPALPSILWPWAGATLGVVVLLRTVAPERLFDLPRERPLIWLAIVVFYPLVSVYPQEILFRAFPLHRYAPVFGTGRAAAAVGAAAFGFAHVIFGNAWSVALTVVGGLLFARRYQQTRSLLTASVEHALYGVLAFTVGLGDLFYAGDLDAAVP